MDFRGSSLTEGKDFNYSGGGDHHKNHSDSVNNQPRRRYFSSAIVKMTLICVVIGLSCIFFLINNDRFDYRTQIVRRSYSFPSATDSTQRNKNEEKNSLEKTLKRAAMKDHRTVIITTLNAAWTEPNSIFDLFLESFRIGIQTQCLLKHVVVVALDKKAYSRCLEVHPHCYALTTPGVDFSGEAYFMSGDYLKMMWRRIDFLRSVLGMGYGFVFSDADIMWLRNPFQRFYPNADFQITCDFYRYNSSTNLHNDPNGGFIYAKSNIRTIQFYKFWYNGKYYFPYKHDQDVFNVIKLNPFITKIGLNIWFLDTAYFGGFCQPSKDLDLVVTMHANCCLGLGNKIHDIKMVLQDWKKYTRLFDVEKSLSNRTWTLPRICGYKNSSRVINETKR